MTLPTTPPRPRSCAPHLSPALPVALLACAWLGCSAGSPAPGPAGTPDAGLISDAGARLDAELAADAGPAADAGLGADLARLPWEPSQGPPALDLASVEAWLRGGAYKAWRCEPAPVKGRMSAHGSASRVCQNAPQTGAAAPPFPAGAASVKELYDASGSSLTGYAFAIRVASGDGGAGRYWYERAGGTLYASGTGIGLCTGCHSAAPKDYTYILVP